MAFSSDKAIIVNQLPLSIDFPEDFNKFLEVHTDIYKRTVNALNSKEGGLYTLEEQYSFKQFFNSSNTQQFRNVYRTTFDLIALNGGNIPAGATITPVPHNISGIMSSGGVIAYCTSSKPEYFSTVYPNIYLDQTNINFTNPSTFPLTVVYVVAEYLKN